MFAVANQLHDAVPLSAEIQKCDCTAPLTSVVFAYCKVAHAARAELCWCRQMRPIFEDMPTFPGFCFQKLVLKSISVYAGWQGKAISTYGRAGRKRLHPPKRKHPIKKTVVKQKGELNKTTNSIHDTIPILMVPTTQA